MPISVEISVEDFLRDMRRIGESPRKDAAQAGFTAAAQTIAAQARRNVSGRGRGAGEGTSARLRGAIKSRAASRASRDLYGGPAAYAWVAVLRGSNRAPAAHLAEFGSRNRRAKNGKFLVFERYGRKIFARRVADQAGTHFFGRAVRSAGAAALERARRAFAQAIGESV